MEQYGNHLAGIPQGIATLLGTLGEDTYCEATWTLRRTKHKFYLDIQWPRIKPFIFPAKKPCLQSHLEKKAQEGPTPPGNTSGDATVKDSVEVIAGFKRSAENRASGQLNSDRPVVSNTGKKRRSPSTRKRNRLRWERWQAKRRAKTSKSSCQPKSESDIRPHDPSGPNQADSETRQPGSETSQSGSETSQPGSETSRPGSETKQFDSERKSTCSSQSDSVTKDSSSLLDNSIAAEVAQPLPRNQCFNCQKPEHSCPEGLKKCTRCNRAFYCGRICQGLDWHRHRRTCKLITGSSDK